MLSNRSSSCLVVTCSGSTYPDRILISGRLSDGCGHVSMLTVNRLQLLVLSRKLKGEAFYGSPCVTHVTRFSFISGAVVAPGRTTSDDPTTHLRHPTAVCEFFCRNKRRARYLLGTLTSELRYPDNHMAPLVLGTNAPSSAIEPSLKRCPPSHSLAQRFALDSRNYLSTSHQIMAPTQVSVPKDLDATIGTVNMVGVILSTITYGVCSRLICDLPSTKTRANRCPLHSLHFFDTSLRRPFTVCREVKATTEAWLVPHNVCHGFVHPRNRWALPASMDQSRRVPWPPRLSGRTPGLHGRGGGTTGQYRRHSSVSGFD